MSNSITYYNRYNVKDIYDIFNKNRVNKISLGTTNKYISYTVGSDYAYTYANVSSPNITDDIYMGCAYFKVNETSYNFYRNYSYTYTENVTVNNLQTIMIAYDFIDRINDNDSIQFNHINIAHNAFGTVNVFSDITYSIENVNNENSEVQNNINKYSITKDGVKNLLGDNTYADFSTYITYSYITSGTGIIHNDGKEILSENGLNDIHIWSLNQEDKEMINYLDIDENMINNTHSYAYISYGNVFSNNSLLTYIDFKLQYPEGDYVPETEFIITTENNEHILKDRQNNFYNICYYYTRSKNEKITFAENNNKFNYICEHPSIRNNESIVIAYTYIKGTNKVNVSYIDNDNYNKIKFEKEIYNLPTAILHNSLYISKIVDNNGDPINSGNGPSKIGASSDSGTVQGGTTLKGYIQLYSGGTVQKDTQGNDYTLSYNSGSKITIEITCTLELKINDKNQVEIESVSKQTDCNISGSVNTNTYLSGEKITNNYNYNYRIYVKDAFTDAPYNVAYVYSNAENKEIQDNNGNNKRISLWLNMNGWAEQNGTGTWLTTVQCKDESANIHLSNGDSVVRGIPYNTNDSGELYIDGTVGII